MKNLRKMIRNKYALMMLLMVAQLNVIPLVSRADDDTQVNTPSRQEECVSDIPLAFSCKTTPYKAATPGGVSTVESSRKFWEYYDYYYPSQPERPATFSSYVELKGWGVFKIDSKDGPKAAFDKCIAASIYYSVNINKSSFRYTACVERLSGHLISIEWK